MFDVSVLTLSQIDNTSCLVLTLSGVLKDILLVIASVLIWGTTVTYLQMFGYSIALGGLVYYKLGADQVKEYLGHRSHMWADHVVRYPATCKAIIFGAVILVLLLVFGAMGP